MLRLTREQTPSPAVAVLEGPEALRFDWMLFRIQTALDPEEGGTESADRGKHSGWVQL